MKTRVALVFAVILIIIPYYNSYGQKTNKRVTISGSGINSGRYGAQKYIYPSGDQRGYSDSRYVVSG